MLITSHTTYLAHRWHSVNDSDEGDGDHVGPYNANEEMGNDYLPFSFSFWLLLLLSIFSSLSFLSSSRPLPFKAFQV